MCFLNPIVGVDCDEVPPVPIPNTEVKLIGAEDTWLEAARENRLMPTPAVAILRSYSSLAQSVEHAAVNRSVVGSSPTGGAKSLLPIGKRLYSYCFLFQSSPRRMPRRGLVHNAVLIQ